MSEDKQPTMVYGPVEDKFNLPGQSLKGDGYYYMVVDAKEVKDCLKDGWKSEPSEVKGKPQVKGNTDKEDKAELEAYAKEKFGIDLDKRKSLEKMQAEVKALEDEHGN